MNPLDWYLRHRRTGDEQVVAEAPELEWSQSHAPRSVEPITVFETLQELDSGSINVHEA